MADSLKNKLAEIGGRLHNGSTMKVTLNSHNLTWKGKSGVTCLTDHYVLNNNPLPETLYVKSSKTGVVKEFYQIHDEDGFDGEFWKYESDDGITVTILND